jgi:hypothetical protein
MVAYTCNPSTQQQDYEFKLSLGYILRSRPPLRRCFQKKKLSIYLSS